MVAIPNGAAYIAAALLAQNHQVEILDLLFENDIETAIVTHLERYHPDLIGISLRQVDNNELFGYRSYLEDTREIIDIVHKHSRAEIVMGGSGFTLFPSELMQYFGLSYGISGDGEKSFPLFVQYLEGVGSLNSIPGICYHDSKEILVKPPAKIYDLETLPFPAYGLLDIQKYLAIAPGLTIQGKRGCDMSCSFCPDGGDKEGCRVRTPESIVDEIQFMVAQYNTNRFHFTDGLFNCPMEHSTEVCREIIKRKLNLSWMVSISPAGITQEIVTAMKMAGCRYISLGIDTASEKMLESYHKGFRKQDIVKTATWLKESGIRFDYSILFAGPGENMDTVQETLDYLKDVPQQAIFRVGIRIFRDTDLEKQAREDGTLQINQNMILPTFYLSKDLPENFMEWLDQQCEDHINWLTITKMAGRRPLSQ